MELDRDMLLQAFAEQSAEGLAAMEESLLALERGPVTPSSSTRYFARVTP